MPADSLKKQNETPKIAISLFSTSLIPGESSKFIAFGQRASLSPAQFTYTVRSSKPRPLAPPLLPHSRLFQFHALSFGLSTQPNVSCFLCQLNSCNIFKIQLIGHLLQEVFLPSRQSALSLASCEVYATSPSL